MSEDPFRGPLSVEELRQLRIPPIPQTYADEDQPLPAPEIMRALIAGSPKLKVQVNASTDERLDPARMPAVFLPSFIEDSTDMDKLEEYTILGKGITLRTEVVVPPPRVEALGTRRWFEEFVPAPRSKQAIKKLRSVILDGVLSVLRAIQQVAVMAVIAHGEGAVIAIATLSEELRKEAYGMRRVPEEEKQALEASVLALTHVVLLAPHVLPAKAYRAFLHEAVPEIVCVLPDESTSILSVIPVKDALTTPCREIALGLPGAVEEQITFPRPAWKRPPDSPLPLYQLRPRVKTKLTVEASKEGRPTMVMEAFAGSAVLTQELVRLGFTGRAYECAPDGPKGDYLPEGDIERPENQHEIAEAIVNDKVFQLHASPSCTTWTPFQALNETAHSGSPRG